MDVRADGLLSLFERHHPEVVMHIAAQPSVPASIDDPVHDATVNVMGLLNVMECCVKSGTRKIVYAASGGTLYGEPRKLPMKETATGRPLSPYGISKKVGLDYLTYYERYRGSRIRRSRWPTSTARGKTRTARAAWWPCSRRR